MAVLFLIFACVAYGTLLSMYQMCIVAEDGKVNKVRVLLVPGSAFLAIVSFLIYLTLNLSQHTTSKCKYCNICEYLISFERCNLQSHCISHHSVLYSKVDMLVLVNFLLYFLKLDLFFGLKKSVSFTVSLMLVSCLLPIHMPIFLSSVSDSLNVNLTEDHEYIVN